MTTVDKFKYNTNNSNNSNNTNNTNNSNNTNNTNNKKNELTVVDYKYICIKKDCFDVNMINLNYNNIKLNNHIEIIYKSPTIILDGIFFKTPPIYDNATSIYYKDKNINNITIKLLIKQKEHPQFIQILKSIDEYFFLYINKFSTEIDNELLLRDNRDNQNIKTLSMLKYEQIIKYYHNRPVYNSSSNSITTKPNDDTYQIYLKSYLDKNIILDLEAKVNKKYIFTFNISNIYFSNNSLLPLIKCNRCECVE